MNNTVSVKPSTPMTEREIIEEDGNALINPLRDLVIMEVALREDRVRTMSVESVEITLERCSRAVKLLHERAGEIYEFERGLRSLMRSVAANGDENSEPAVGMENKAAYVR